MAEQGLGLDTLCVEKPLPECMEEFIILKLESLESGNKREAVLALLRNLPLDGFKILEHAAGNLDDFTQRFQKARGRGQVYWWVLPQMAAIAFEGVFEACVLFWLAIGPPGDEVRLSPEVRQFVRIQARLFASSIGA